MELLVFGTEDAGQIASIVARFAREQLGSPVREALFERTSVGVVLGLELEDTRRVVVKAHQPRQRIEFLRTVFETQRHLTAEGFPCPAPVIPPAPMGAGFATVEEFVGDGFFADPHNPHIYEAMAKGLARLVELTRPLGAPPSLRQAWSLWDAEGLWPETAHSPIFDFAATAEGAGWIDELATEAKALVPLDGEELVVHSDWSGKHFRFNDRGEITVVYDWDSLGLRTEVQALGIAAATFTSNFELDLFHAPSPDEATAFIEAYSDARAVPLSEAEVLAAHAVSGYLIAYTARCEHALGRRGDFTEALARFGRAYLAPAYPSSG